MSLPSSAPPPPLTTLADGTIKQLNPFSGTEVWTVPGRGNRPLTTPSPLPRPLTAADRTASCAFCESTPLATPPEKARLVGGKRGWELLTDLLPGQLEESRAEFRRVPNLFEIVSYEYWSLNYGFRMDRDTRDRQARYLADPAGRAHVADIVRTWLAASGQDTGLPERELLACSDRYFAGGHDVVIARRHYTDQATDTSQLASAGTLTQEEHRGFTSFTVAAMHDLYARNRYARYVVAFQNWLAPAGASFDHLHKQLVAIDEYGTQVEQEIMRLRVNPNMYNEWGVDYAHRHNLVVAANDHAVCFAGFGHRYPTLEIYSRSGSGRPWEQSPAEIADMSDLLHACHAATGAAVPCNEEWHHRPPGLDLEMPWRINLKWRVSTLAGFEGSTRIYVNTLSPGNIRSRMVAALTRLRESGKISADLRIGAECDLPPNALAYHLITG
ncbi:DUF4921 family protein [Corynebacterium halotolerans]|uniref:DUF4921 family protein n=1 Tax=Corynebacterium halotolerans TaxID=225326 RepID=UPI003CF50CD5